MNFNRKALGIAMGVVATAALALTAMPASAADVTGNAYYAAGEGQAKKASSDKRVARGGSSDKRVARGGDRRGDGERRDGDKSDRDWKDDGYSRDVERIKEGNTVGREATITNDETGKSVIRERTTTRDPDTGTLIHTDEITGPNGEQRRSSTTTAVRTDDGHAATTIITTPDGLEAVRTVDVSKDPDSQTITRTQTATGADGEIHSKDSTVTRTEDGFTRTTEFESGATTHVDATYNEETGEWERDVERTRGDDDNVIHDDSSAD